MTISAETFLELRTLLISGWLQRARDMGLQYGEIDALFHNALIVSEAQ